MNINKLTNTKLKKIVNVYQLDYTNGKSPGIGDFLRGSFCLMQLSKLLNISFDIDISNHPLSKYIEDTNHTEGINYNNIEYYYSQNWNDSQDVNYEGKIRNINITFLNDIINWLNTKDCEVFGFMSNAFPFFNKHTEEGRNYINSKLRPNKFMQDYVDNTLIELNLSKKTYGVIHIRTGDKHLHNAPMSMNFIIKIKKILNRIIVPGKRYLLISDSNVLKSHLRTRPNLYTLIREIEHLGGGGMKNQNSNGIMNTMLDFYLMGNSNAIISLSVYDHVSGFSKYCSILNNIPFKYISIKE